MYLGASPGNDRRSASARAARERADARRGPSLPRNLKSTRGLGGNTRAERELIRLLHVCARELAHTVEIVLQTACAVRGGTVSYLKGDRWLTTSTRATLGHIRTRAKGKR